MNKPNTQSRVAVDRVDWLSVAPVLRLASAFRHALQPGKLVVALLAVLVIHLSGSVLDLLWGQPVEMDGQEVGVYEALVRGEGHAFGELVGSALSLKVGIGPDTVGVVDALHSLFVQAPATLFDEYPWFTLLFGAIVLLVLTIAAGIICRMSVTQVCANQITALPRAAKFVARRWVWYVLTPLMPALLILIVGGVLILAGLVLFNLEWLNVVGSLVYGLLLVLGFVIALVSVLMIFALFLMAPALSVEGTDGFDAIARSFNYVMFKPWQFAGYLLAAVAYAAVVYVLIVAIAGLTRDATASFISVGVVRDLDGSSFQASAWIINRWHELLAGIVIALMFSVVCCLQTQVYVLMRRSADGTPMDQCAADDEQDPWSSPADMVDPQSQALAEAGSSAAVAAEPGSSTTPSEG